MIGRERLLSRKVVIKKVLELKYLR